MERETINYRGKNYHRYPESKRPQLRNYFYRHDKWKESPVALHRQVYEDANGPIPKGYQIHHKDEDFTNNSIENLECLTIAEHRKLHPMSKEARARTSERSRENDPLGEWRKNNPELAKEAAVKNGSKSQGLDNWRKENPELANETYIEAGRKGGKAGAGKKKGGSLQHNGGGLS